LELSQKEGPAPPAMGNVKVDSGLSKSVVDYVALGEKVFHRVFGSLVVAKTRGFCPDMGLESVSLLPV